MGTLRHRDEAGFAGRGRKGQSLGSSSSPWNLFGSCPWNPVLCGRDFHRLSSPSHGRINLLCISITPLYQCVYSAITKIIAWKMCLLISLTIPLGPFSYLSLLSFRCDIGGTGERADKNAQLLQHSRNDKIWGNWHFIQSLMRTNFPTKLITGNGWTTSEFRGQ